MMKLSRLFFLCTLWILVTGISYSIAMSYGFSLIQESRSTWNEHFLKAICIGGLLSGLGQWALITTRMKRTAAWVFANTLGIPLGFILGHYLYSGFDSLALARMGEGIIPFDWTDIAYPIVVISIAGTVLGILQWLVLKNQVRFAYWWILASILGWNIGLYFGAKTLDLMNPAIWNYNWSISGSVFGIVLGGIVGIIGSAAIGRMLANVRLEP